jgi:tetraacyldisaccharide 4'-kinase
VGNLTVGGTGKTPVVEYLARELTARGRRVAILSRGYGSKHRLFSGSKPRVVSDGRRILLKAEEAGDEPFMLAKNLENVVVISGGNRLQSAFLARENYGCNVLILDDGFQYLRLRSQISLLLINKPNPFGNGHLLPRGVLREPISAMGKATHILLTRANSVSNENLNLLLKKYARAPLMESCLVTSELRSPDGVTFLPLKAVEGKRVATFSGIANPESFEDFINSAGACVLCNHRFPDHHSFSSEEIDQICKKSTGLLAEMLITTEKDVVRLPNDLIGALPIFYLRIHVKIIKGLETWENLLSDLSKQTE